MLPPPPTGYRPASGLISSTIEPYPPSQGQPSQRSIEITVFLRAAALALLACLLLWAAGCGGNSDETTSEGSSNGVELAEAEESGEGAAGDEKSDEPSKNGSGGEFCESVIAEIQAALGLIEDETREGGDDFETGMAALRNIEVPDEISEEWEVLTNAMTRSLEILSELESLNENQTKQAETLTSELESIQADLNATGTTVDKYVQDSCGISLSEAAE